jgi:hypothetical protein
VSGRVRKEAEDPDGEGEKGVRKEDFVRPYLKKMEKQNPFGVYFIFLTMGPTGCDACPGPICSHCRRQHLSNRDLYPHVLETKVAQSRRYRLLPQGYSICLVFLKLFDRIYAPLTAGLLEPVSGDSKLQQQKRTQVDRLYQKLVDDRAVNGCRWTCQRCAKSRFHHKPQEKQKPDSKLESAY